MTDLLFRSRERPGAPVMEGLTRAVIPRGRGGGRARNPLPKNETHSVGGGFLAHPQPRPLGMTDVSLEPRVTAHAGDEGMT